MKCPTCEHSNPEQVRFCNHCGQKLIGVCAQCGAQNAEEANFCSACGNKLLASSASNESGSFSKELKEPVQPTKRKAERRQLTVLFCDLIGSTALSARLDPEEFRQVILDYQQVAEKVIRRYDGHIAQYLGDGLLVYFGYPKGLEDAPRAGVRAGLGIIEAVEQANRQWASAGKTEIAIRIGIHTGIVVVDDQQALGDTTNIAARLEGLAPPNGLVISPQTLKLIQGWFEVKSLGKQTLKGIDDQVEIFQVLSESGARSRLDIVSHKGLSPLVGREEEMKLLLSCWERAKTGNRQLILLSGEAGLGKSRLADAVKEQIAREPNAWLTEMRCSAYHRNSAFYPVIELLERVVLQFEAEDDDQRKIDKLQAFLLQSGLGGEANLGLFMELLSIPLRESVAPLTLSPAAKKKKTVDALLQALLHRAATQPLLLVIEDLHWADESTLEWLDLFVNQSVTHTIFALCTTRPEYQPSWIGCSNTTQLVLTRLSHDKIEVICRRQANGKALPAAVLEQIKIKTDGIPLFVEELTQMILESGLLIEKEDRYELRPQYQSGLPPFAIPSTLQDSLLARLDKLAPVKELIQVGAIIGREFSFELLQAVTERDAAELERELNQLVEAELLYQRGPAPKAQYTFKHALIQDAAYSTLLKSSRGRWHRRIAEVLKHRFPHVAMAQPETVAHHLTEAGQFGQALLKWEEAGNLAFNRSANQAAMLHFQKALELLPHMENAGERDAKELDILPPYNTCVMLLKGWGHPEVEQISRRILHLCDTNQNIEKSLMGYAGLMAVYMLQGKFSMFLETMEKEIQLVKGLDDVAVLSWALVNRADIYFHMGKLDLMVPDLEKAMELYDDSSPAEQSKTLLMGSGEVPAFANYEMSLFLTLSGFPDQARKIIDANKDFAVKRNDITTVWRGYMNQCYAGTFLKEYDKVKEAAEAALAILAASGEWGLSSWIQFHAYLQEALEEGGSDLSKVKALMNTLWISGIKYAHTACFYFLIEKYIEQKDYQRGIESMEEAMNAFSELEEKGVESGLYRQKGDLLILKDPQDPEAENWYFKAIDVAQRQKAKWFELLAVKSLARLWQSQGRIRDAYEILNAIYSWFTEGFDTIDMQEAKRLLNEFKAQMDAG